MSQGDGSAGADGSGIAADASGSEAAASSNVDGVSLTVESATQLGTIGTVSPTAGDLFVAVDITLTNGSSASLPLTTSLFGAVTQSGVQYSASALTAGYSGGCNPNVSLTPGSQTACALVFETPLADPLREALYTLPSGATVVATIGSVRICTPCANACVDLGSDPLNCGSCGNVASGGSCNNGVPTCDVNDALCNGACTVESLTMCGTCGQPQLPCGAGANNCLQGHCTITKSSSVPTSCDSLCGTLGCYGVTAAYGSQANPQCDPSSPYSISPAARRRLPATTAAHFSRFIAIAGCDAFQFFARVVGLPCHWAWRDMLSADVRKRYCPQPSLTKRG